jgi:hypothetical protein
MDERSGDRSVVSLVAVNVFALALAWATGMTAREVILLYLIQSVVIGATSFIRILKLERFDPGGVTINKRALEETPAAKKQIAGFFALHYGVFHLVYFVFVISPGDPEADANPLGPFWPYALCALAFAVNHGYSLAANLAHDAGGRPKIGTIMMLPYARILPMHVIILIGGTFLSGTATYIVFGILKTIADVVMHVVEHRVLRRSATGT